MAMTEQKPRMDGLGMKLRDKSYRGKKTAEQQMPYMGPTMAKRDQHYAGIPLEKQTDAHKGAGMHKRAKGYMPPKAGTADTNRLQELNPANVLTNYEFIVTMGGERLSCARVSNLSQSLETEEFVEGGNPDFPVILASAKKKSDTLHIEQAWTTDRQSADFAVGVYVTGGTIEILNHGQSIKKLGFDSGLITKCDFSDLDALGTNVMIRKLEIAHSGLYVV